MRIDRVRMDRACDYLPIVGAINNVIDGIQKRVFKNKPDPSEYQRHILDKSWKKCLLFSIPFAKIIYKIWERILFRNGPQVEPVLQDPVPPVIDRMEIVERTNQERIPIRDLLREYNVSVFDLTEWIGPEACQRLEYLDLTGIPLPLDGLTHFIERVPNVRHYMGVGLMQQQFREIIGWRDLETVHVSNSPHLSQDSLQALNRLPNLVSLSVDGLAQLRGNLQGLHDCPNLRSLSINGCVNLDADALGVLEHCPELEVLHFDDCKQIDDLEFLQYLPNLRSLHMDNCDQVPADSLILTQNFEELHFNNCNQLDPDTLIHLLPHCGGLRRLHVDGCDQLAAESLRSLQNCAFLTELHIDGTSFEANVLSVLENCTLLRSLSIRELAALEEDALDVLRFCAGLEVLKITESRVAGQSLGLRPDSLNVLAHCPKLKELDMQSCPSFEANMLQVLENCPELETLRISNMDQLAPNALAVLEHCPNLQSLSILRCPSLHPNSLNALEHCPHLKHLWIGLCNYLNPASLNVLLELMELKSVEIIASADLSAAVDRMRGTLNPRRCIVKT